MKPILQVKNIVKTFPIKKNILGKTVATVKALSDVSFDVFEGEVLGLVGESGCGKSTLGRSILKLLEVDSGQILYKGQDITHYNSVQMRPLRREMQIIFQDPFSSLNPRMKVGSAIIEPMAIHNIVPKKERYEKAVELLELVGLDETAMLKYPREFSGGQRQRIGIARALSVQPRFIVADEAVSALDISIQAQIINLLVDLKEGLGLTLLFIAHDIKLVEHIADRVCVMYLGKIMEVFNADQMASSRHPYTQSLLSAMPIPDPTVKLSRQILPGDPPSPINPPSGCVFHTRCSMAVENCAVETPRLKQINNKHLIACDLLP